jgi:CCR4-NOT transcription complex subunit 3
VLKLLEASYKSHTYQNMPGPFDQEVKDPLNPVPIGSVDHFMFPTVPMYNRRENFSKFDLNTLFFVFYYHQGTYQQYMAAIELKKQNWRFHKKYHTWFKKMEEA